MGLSKRQATVKLYGRNINMHFKRSLALSLGAFTLLSVWMKQKEPHVRYSEETIAIG